MTMARKGAVSYDNEYKIIVDKYMQSHKQQHHGERALAEDCHNHSDVPMLVNPTLFSAMKANTQHDHIWKEFSSPPRRNAALS